MSKILYKVGDVFWIPQDVVEPNGTVGVITKISKAHTNTITYYEFWVQHEPHTRVFSQNEVKKYFYDL